MPVQLNIIKSTITPQIKNISSKKVLHKTNLMGATSNNIRKLRDFGHPEPNPNADQKNESHMAKTTLGGMAAGATTGAAIGSAIPIVGTAFGALVGGALGALGGATVGLFTNPKK